MSFITDLFDALKDEKRVDLILPDALTFSSLDVAALERELGVVTEAKEAAVHERPVTSATDLDTFEKGVIDRVMQLVRPAQQSFADAMSAYKTRLAALDPLGFDARLRGEVARHKAQLQMEVNQVRGEMFLLIDDLQQREAEYQSYKQRYNNPPDPDIRFPLSAKYALLAALVAAEAALNSLFLGPFMSGGGWEGFAWAFAFPFLSLVFFGWIGGYWLRRSVYASPLPKLAYLSGVFATVIAALSVNLALAALRTAAEQSEDFLNTTVALWHSFLTLQAFPRIDGLILLSVGMACFVGALFDLKSLDHPIPGYLAAFNSRQRAHQAYKDKMKSLHERLKEAGQAATDLTGASATLQNWQIEHNNILVNQETLWRKYKEYIRHVERAVNKLLGKYRETNARTRTTPAPTYFDTPWIFPEFFEPATDAKAAVADFQEKLNGVFQRIDRLTKELTEEIQKTGTIIPTIDTAVVTPKVIA